MCAEVRVDAATMERLKVKNGLRQGCTLAPTLFNIYFSAMVANWYDECMGAGGMLLYKHGKRLVDDHTSKARLSEVRVTETQSADDVAFFANSRNTFESIAINFVSVANYKIV